MKKMIAVLFVLCAAALSVFLILRIYFPKKNKAVVRSRTVTPIVNKQAASEEISDDIIQDDASKTTFIPLLSDETLIQSLSVDFNNDGSDDQIIEVKKIGSPYLYIIVGLYNIATAAYERTAKINTKITREQTFSFTGMDIVGNHTITLVYQGFTENGDSVLKMYQTQKEGDAYKLRVIGDFESDDIIFIDQKERSDSYELFQSRGESFPIWVYSSDKTAPDSLSRIQTEYDWSDEEHKYVRKLEYKVPGRKIAAKELAKIQDGTVETFANFLNGLWYKTEDKGKTMRYLYFDWSTKEIIFLYEDSEEVYSWLNSNVRRNGIYLYTTNTSISNLQRRMDISLVDVDEVKVRLQDDVRMIIKEENLWDGIYKKMSAQNQFTAFTHSKNTDTFVKDLESAPEWSASDGSTLAFENDKYTSKQDSDQTKGFFTCFMLNDAPMIQFEKRSGDSSISGIYVMSYDSEKDGTVVNHDKIIMRPVIINPENYSFDDSRIQFVIEKKTVKEQQTDE